MLVARAPRCAWSRRTATPLQGVALGRSCSHDKCHGPNVRDLTTAGPEQLPGSSYEHARAGSNGNRVVQGGQVLRLGPGGPRHRPGDRAGRDGRAARPERRRQVDDDRHDPRAHPTRQRDASRCSACLAGRGRAGRLGRRHAADRVAARSPQGARAGHADGVVLPAPARRRRRAAADGDADEFADRWTTKLSGGQAQRVRFAAALVGDPDLLVLDEPTAGIDVEGRREFWQAMRAVAERGKTILFATHYLEEADAYADRIVLMARGRIVADGPATEIKARAGPRTIRATLPDADLAGCGALPGRGERRASRRRRASCRARTPTPRSRPAQLVPGRRGTSRCAGASLEEAFLELTADEDDTTIETPPATATSWQEESQMSAATHVQLRDPPDVPQPADPLASRLGCRSCCSTRSASSRHARPTASPSRCTS